ncbi:MAG: hypothetical protein HZA93_07425 [Verrucomicrobia bacterium]|nr:hypothetical protein [Verrucomicrobiota bacterium]
MKICRFLSIQLLTIACGFGAAPDGIDGKIYYEDSSTRGVGQAFGSDAIALVLKSDGTFTGLVRVSSVSSPQLFPRGLANGTYSYKKIDSQTAQLTLSGIPLAGSTSVLRVLKFTSDDAGTILRDDNFFFGSIPNFRIAAPSSPPALVNCSNRSFVRAGGTAFTGFVIAPGPQRMVLVRAIGPSLAAFGITDTLGDPRLTVVRATNNTQVANNDDWNSDLDTPFGSVGRADVVTRTSVLVGAFPLVENSKDAVVILSLTPGAYIAQVSSANANDSGQALIEVYILP